MQIPVGRKGNLEEVAHMCVSLNLIKSVYFGGCMAWFCVRVCVFVCGIAMATQYSQNRLIRILCCQSVTWLLRRRSYFFYVSLPKHSACRARTLDMNPLPAEAARCRTSLNKISSACVCARVLLVHSGVCPNEHAYKNPGSRVQGTRIMWGMACAQHIYIYNANYNG